MHELILASQSPRRKKILEEAGYQFRTFPIEVSEILDENLNWPDQISHCARQKALAAEADLKGLESQNILILSADTMVVFRESALGKPKNINEASSILSQLSGQVHQVITGFCLLDLRSKHLVLGHETTDVQFRTLSQTEIAEYVATGEPMDKAGAYGIQGGGRKFVEEFHGDFLNVVGLPLKKIEKTWEENGWIIAKQN